MVEATQCENEGSVVGNKRCASAATHRVVIHEGEDDYESFLCGPCFAGFREEMIQSGNRPLNEAALEPSKAEVSK